MVICNALNGKPLRVYGRGENIRDWLYVDDNCRAIDLVLQKGRAGEIYNIGGGCEKCNIEVVKMICKLLSQELKKPVDEFLALITFIKDPRGEVHDFRYALDCRKIRDELSWEPSVGFEEGLKRTVR